MYFEGNFKNYCKCPIKFIEYGIIFARPGSDHVTSWPIRGLKKNCTQWRIYADIPTDKHGDSKSETADSVKGKK